MKKIFSFVMAAWAMISMGCAFATAPRELLIGSYNLENLFDGRDQGTEYSRYRVASGQWSEEKAMAKAGNLARVLRAVGGADLWVFQEVENRRTLDQLVHLFLRGEGYDYRFCTEEPDAAIQIGVISRIPIAEIGVHRVDSGPGDRERLRPVVEIRLETRRGPVVVLGCHFKSRLGGIRETEPLRVAAADLAGRVARGVEAGIPVVLAGDLNESWDDAEGVEYPTALGARGILVSGAREERSKWFNPWSESSAVGSYAYRGVWESLDHLLVNGALRDSRGWEYESFEVLTPDFIKNESGYPMRFQPKSLRGFSDHFPVRVKLIWATGD